MAVVLIAVPLYTTQVMKQFLVSYLHCHGMLFSGVGLDRFRECCVNMLREFSVLLRATPPRLSTSHLLQIMAINMYAITNTELKGECCVIIYSLIYLCMCVYVLVCMTRYIFSRQKTPAKIKHTHTHTQAEDASGKTSEITAWQGEGHKPG